MKITNLANFRIDFITKDDNNVEQAIVLNPGEFAYTVSDEKNRSINLHGARRNLYIDIEDIPEGLEPLIPYTKESADQAINVHRKVGEYVQKGTPDVQINIENTFSEPESITPDVQNETSDTASPVISTGSLQDELVLTEEGKESVKLEEIVIEDSDPYAEINIEGVETEEPKKKKKPSSRKGPGRPKKRGPKKKKKPRGRPPGSKNKKR